MNPPVFIVLSTAQPLTEPYWCIIATIRAQLS